MGKPTLFITSTANTNWPEITENLRFLQIPTERPELVARVFYLKKVSSLDHLIKSGAPHSTH